MICFYSIKNVRIPRKAALPAGCENGNVNGFAHVPHCHVTSAKYNAKMKLCLVEIALGKINHYTFWSI